MACECIPKLEMLLKGKTESVELNRTEETTREHILNELTNLLMNLFPDLTTQGVFVNKDCREYLIYDLQLSSMKFTNSFSSIRLLDFGDMFRLVRV